MVKKLNEWYFFPVWGLEITDENFDFEKPIWGNAGIFSVSFVNRLFLNAFEENSSSGYIEKTKSIIENLYIHSFIGIKRIYNTNIDKDEGVIRRLNQIFSIIQFAILIDKNTN
jgi:hypothetical protein